ncbi:Hypothetical protein CAP_7172 [Chondromyces apiculatus DSM 436]|uniref:Uncharacterized protein n=1 Tax=Chondromyces apiculatus DSM 436 TaxID=1192034 RepID=A0A017T1F4_9BACT|nr:Hypothetical protein CAP_7172 [Chondromyces apiculatus DSM 436]
MLAASWSGWAPEPGLRLCTPSGRRGLLHRPFGVRDQAQGALRRSWRRLFEQRLDRRTAGSAAGSCARTPHHLGYGASALADCVVDLTVGHALAQADVHASTTSPKSPRDVVECRIQYLFGQA